MPRARPIFHEELVVADRPPSYEQTVAQQVATRRRIGSCWLAATLVALSSAACSSGPSKSDDGPALVGSAIPQAAPGATGADYTPPAAPLPASGHGGGPVGKPPPSASPLVPPKGPTTVVPPPTNTGGTPL